MRDLARDPKGSPLLNMFNTYYLGPMSRDELAHLLRTPLGDEYTVTDEAVDRVAALSGGRPLIAQSLGHEALEACRKARRFRMEAEDIDQAFQDKVFYHLINTVYGYPARWESLPKPVREVLRRLAGQPTDGHEDIDPQTLQLLDTHGFADMVRRRIDVEPPFLLWIRRVPK
jgi:hypothetical protein